MKILILGASGLLGSTVFRVLSTNVDWQVIGTVRNPKIKELFAGNLRDQLIVCGDLAIQDELVTTFECVEPDIVINCLSITKTELNDANLQRVLMNLSVLPQRISRLCALGRARMVHISSDGVFSGAKGGYSEDDHPDAIDTYGIAKLLGEISSSHAISIRTSIIGHELNSAHGLLEWFLSAEKECRCFTRATFSGFPTVELARIIRDHVIPRPDLSGIYHVASHPISKFDLMRLVASVYSKVVAIVPDDRVVIDRSLNADRFRAATGYVAPDWPNLVQLMHADHVQTKAVITERSQFS